MKIETITIDGNPYDKMVADEGKTFRIIHNGFIIGDTVILATDWSTGTPREDKPEYYEEIAIPEDLELSKKDK